MRGSAFKHCSPFWYVPWHRGPVLTEPTFQVTWVILLGRAGNMANLEFGAASALAFCGVTEHTEIQEPMLLALSCVLI